MKKKRGLLGFLFVLATAFISLNVFLALKIKELRNEKNVAISLIQQSADLERESFNQLLNIDDYNLEEINKGIEFFEKKGLELEKNKYLESLQLRIDDLESYSNHPTDNVQPKMLKVLYGNINIECRQVISSLRKLNQKTETELKSYFNINYIIVFLACILAIVVLVLSYLQLKTNRAYFKVSKMHSLLLESSIDFVMISDRNKKVIEFNKAAQEAFGYTLEEVQELGRDGLFHDKKDNLKLSKAINEKGFFKGEIVNRRKNGELFTSFLTANVILDKNGKRIGTMGVSRDITQEKRDVLLQKKQSREIQKSIEYASGLQNATLPTKEEITSIFPNHFLIYKPKDVLSGDFYLTEKIIHEGSEFAYLVIADCTGHGIPGAILSTYCNGLIKLSFKIKSIQTPGQMLDFAKNRIGQFFNSNKTNTINDGMDAAICKFDLKQNILHFSGANSCCIIIRKGEIIKLAATKQSVCFSDDTIPFKDHSIQLESGDAIYLATDGYVDQFGGPNNKKYLKKQFTKLLLSISHLPISEQEIIIQEEFRKWKGDEDQTDDVLFFGLKV